MIATLLALSTGSLPALSIGKTPKLVLVKSISSSTKLLGSNIGKTPKLAGTRGNESNQAVGSVGRGRVER